MHLILPSNVLRSEERTSKLFPLMIRLSVSTKLIPSCAPDVEYRLAFEKALGKSNLSTSFGASVSLKKTSSFF
ncbi:hypothetical protein SDC9_116373 [bioreactor metagenome]|uniref:Uncharacterized protein n=1 Tax=bioreactor metagenome TaxID=1076179 RepID=A0A645BWE6_9ZZZZ